MILKKNSTRVLYYTYSFYGPITIKNIVKIIINDLHVYMKYNYVGACYTISAKPIKLGKKPPAVIYNNCCCNNTDELFISRRKNSSRTVLSCVDSTNTVQHSELMVTICLRPIKLTRNAFVLRM